MIFRLKIKNAVYFHTRGKELNVTTFYNGLFKLDIKSFRIIFSVASFVFLFNEAD